LPERATKHVRRPQLPPGTVNRKGKIKVINSTGGSRYVDAKKGLGLTTEGKLTVADEKKK
jgi:hypothetical protein